MAFGHCQLNEERQLVGGILQANMHQMIVTGDLDPLLRIELYHGQLVQGTEVSRVRGREKVEASTRLSL